MSPSSSSPTGSRTSTTSIMPGPKVTPRPKAKPGLRAMAADRTFLPASAEPAFVEDPIAEGIAPFGSDLLGARRLIAYLLLTLALMPVQALLVLLRTRLAERLPVFYHRLCCRLMGIA